MGQQSQRSASAQLQKLLKTAWLAKMGADLGEVSLPIEAQSFLRVQPDLGMGKHRRAGTCSACTCRSIDAHPALNSVIDRAYITGESLLNLLSRYFPP